MASRLHPDRRNGGASSSSGDAVEHTKSASGSKPKRTRKRMALSCLPCKVSKRKCDRNVPECSSCVLRGMEDQCRWGDARDHVSPSTSASTLTDGNGRRKKQRVQSNGQTAPSLAKVLGKHRKSTMDASGKMDEIVEAVLKRMKSSRSRDEVDSESEASESEVDEPIEDRRLSSGRASGQGNFASLLMAPPNGSAANDGINAFGLRKWGCKNDLLGYGLKPQENLMASITRVTAFQGEEWKHPLLTKGHLHDRGRGDFVDVNMIKESLNQLPGFDVINFLIASYLEELEPLLNIFNRHILTQQLNELREDMEELGIITNTNLSTSVSLPLPRAFVPKEMWTMPASTFSDRDDASEDDGASTTGKDCSAGARYFQFKNTRLCSIPRQGLIAVIFMLCDLGARASRIEKLMEIGMTPRGMNAQEAERYLIRWCDRLNTLAFNHMRLSQFISRATLWSVQFTFLTDVFVTAAVRWGLKFERSLERQLSGSGLGLRLAVGLGLNRLGSAYEDLERIKRTHAERRSQFTLSKERQSGMNQRNASGDDEDARQENHQNEQDRVLLTMRQSTFQVEFDLDNIAHRELGRKLWTVMKSMDSFFSSHFFHFNNIHDGVDFTAPPAPVDDADLLSPYAATLIEQSSPFAALPRDNTYLAYFLASSMITRRQVELENFKGAPLPYSDLLELDHWYDELLDMLPPFLNFTDEERKVMADPSFTLVQPTDVKSKTMLVQKCMMNDQIHFRRLRMHRLHIGQGFKDERYRRSVTSCLRAARGILDVRSVLSQLEHSCTEAIFLRSHLLQASYVFQSCLLHEVGRRRAEKSALLRRVDGQGRGATAESDGETYKLDDFDGTVQQLSRTVDYLEAADAHDFMKDQISAVKTFMQNLASTIAREEATASTKRHPRTIRRDEAVVRHGSSAYDGRVSGSSEASSGSPFVIEMGGGDAREGGSVARRGGEYPLDMTRRRADWIPTSMEMSPHTAMSTCMPAISPSQSQAQSNTPSNDAFLLDAYDPSIWSLEALFPDYATGHFDLISALEREALTGNTNYNQLMQQQQQQIQQQQIQQQQIQQQQQQQRTLS